MEVKEEKCHIQTIFMTEISDFKVEITSIWLLSTATVVLTLGVEVDRSLCVRAAPDGG